MLYSPELCKLAVWLGNPFVGVHHILLHIKVGILIILEKFRILNENKNFTLKYEVLIVTKKLYRSCTECRMQNAVYRIQNTECRNAEYRVKKCRIQNCRIAENIIHNAEYRCNVQFLPHILFPCRVPP